ATADIGDQKRAPRHAVHSGEERRHDAQQRDEAAEEHNLGPVLQVQVLTELDTGFKHPNALTVSQEERVTVSQSEPLAGAPTIAPNAATAITTQTLKVGSD